MPAWIKHRWLVQGLSDRGGTLQGETATVGAGLECRDRRRSNGYKLKDCKSRSDVRKNCLLWGGWDTGTGCRGSLCLIKDSSSLGDYFSFAGNIQPENFSCYENQNGHKVYQIAASASTQGILINEQEFEKRLQGENVTLQQKVFLILLL